MTSVNPNLTDYEPHPLTDEHYNASAGALTELTTRAENKNQPPTSHIHGSSSTEESHAWLSKFLPKSTIQSVENKFHLGNYVLDRQTGEKTWEAMSIYVRVGMHLLYYGSAQEQALHWKKTLDLLKTQSEKMGKEYDAPESKQHIVPFIQSFNLENTLHEMVKPNPNDYSTFNEFFAREIKESARPIAEPDNDFVTSSPADCRLTAFPTVDLARKYWIKGFGFTLATLLGDEQLAARFEGGSIVIARLAPQDYHRWHAPVSGTVRGIKDISGAYYTVNPQAINEPGTLDVFCENKRSVMMLQRSSTGSPIAIVAVGAMLVGSIKYVGGVDTIGAEVRRGQCLGAFYYGGSTVIVLYPPGEVVLDDDLVKNSTELGMETYVKVGWMENGYPALEVLLIHRWLSCSPFLRADLHCRMLIVHDLFASSREHQCVLFFCFLKHLSLAIQLPNMSLFPKLQPLYLNFQSPLISTS